jgi:hypothetical protein
LFDSLNKVWGKLIIKVFSNQIGIDGGPIGGGRGDASPPFDFTDPLQKFSSERALGNFESDFSGAGRGQAVIHVGQECSQCQSHRWLPSGGRLNRLKTHTFLVQIAGCFRTEIQTDFSADCEMPQGRRIVTAQFSLQIPGLPSLPSRFLRT